MKKSKLLEFIRTNIKWIICFLALFLFFVITHTILNKEILNIDTSIFKIVRSVESPIFTTFFKLITQLASLPVFLILCLSILLFLKKKIYFWIIAINLVNITVLNSILKLIFKRPRPLDIALITETGFSFPSGHSMASMAFYGLLIYLIHQSNLKKNQKKGLTILLGVIIMLIGISRIYLGVHYASDVIAGFSLTLAYLILFTKFIAKYLRSNYEKEEI